MCTGRTSSTKSYKIVMYTTCTGRGVAFQSAHHAVCVCVVVVVDFSHCRRVGCRVSLLLLILYTLLCALDVRWKTSHNCCCSRIAFGTATIGKARDGIAQHVIAASVHARRGKDNVAALVFHEW
jgi:hypothetical protein